MELMSFDYLRVPYMPLLPAGTLEGASFSGDCSLSMFSLFFTFCIVRGFYFEFVLTLGTLESFDEDFFSSSSSIGF